MSRDPNPVDSPPAHVSADRLLPSLDLPHASFQALLDARLGRILEGMADGIIAQSASGHVVFCNAAAARQCGVAGVPDLLAMGLHRALERLEIHDETGAPVQPDDLAAGGTRVLRLRDRSSGRHWFSRVQTTAFHDIPGDALMVSVWHDVTSERRARDQFALLARAGEAFAESRSNDETMRSVVDVALPALGDFAFVDVIEGAQVRRHAAAFQDPEVDALIRGTQWVRSTRTDINLCALSSGVSALHASIDDAWLADVARSPEQLARMRRMQLRSMITVPLRVRSEVLGSLTACFGRSGRRHTIDDVKLAEELARRAGMALEQVHLLEAAQRSALRAEAAAERAADASRVKDEFLATVSHELRTPLNTIVGWSSLLLKRGPDPTTSKGMDAILRNAQMQGKLIEDILDVSRIITGKLRLDVSPASLEAIVADAIEVVRPSAVAKGLLVQFEPPRESLAVAADPERLQQVIWNLLSNAVKFTEAGGRITVSLARDGSTAAVTVRDTGQGIEPAFLPFVFDRFTQADGSTTRRVGGLGLGLSIVRHIVELHGGQVHAASPGPGAGATFTIVLPLEAPLAAAEGRAGTPAPPRTAAQGGPAASLAGVRVLIIDDDPDTRELLQLLIHSAGAIADTAESAARGYARLTSFQPHVLVSDVGMPGEDGYSLIERIRARDDAAAGIPAIALTAYARHDDRARAIAAGFTTHLGKPVSAEEFLAVVARLAGAGRDT